MKLKYKLSTIFLIIGILPLSILCFVSYTNNNNSIDKITYEILNNAIEDIEKKTEYYVETKIQLLEQIAANSIIKKVSDSEDPEVKASIQNEINAIYENISKSKNNYIEIIGVWNLEGEIIANNISSLNGEIMSKKILDLTLTQGNYFSGHIQDHLTGKPFMLFSSTIKKDNKNIGIVIIKVNINSAPNISFFNKSDWETFETVLPYLEQDSFIKYIKKPQHVAVSPKIFMGSKRGIVSQKAVKGSIGFGVDIDYNQKRVYAAWKPIEIANWYVVAKIDADILDKDKIRFRNTLFIIWLFSLLFGMLIIYFYSENISKALNNLSNTLNSITQGKKDLNFTALRNDEIGGVAIAAKESIWFQEGIIKVNNAIKSVTTTIDLSEKLISIISEHLEMQLGAFYLREEDAFKLSAFIGCNLSDIHHSFVIGEGLLGKACKEGKHLLLSSENYNTLSINSSFASSSHISIAIIPIVDEEDKVIAVIEFASLVDINSLKFSFLTQIVRTIATSIEKIRVNEQINKILLENTQRIDVLNQSAIVSETDPYGNITFVNDKFCKISGYNRAELIGQNHRMIKSNKQPQGIFVGMWKAISIGRVWKGEIINKKKGDNGYYWVDTTIMPFLDNEGEIEKYVAIRFDITIQKEQQKKLIENLEEISNQTEELRVSQEELTESNTELEEQTSKLQANEEELRVQQEELLQSNQELEEKTQSLEEQNNVIDKARIQMEIKAKELEETSRYKSEFLANMSHELRTPLNSILLLSKLLFENNDKNLNANQIQFADVIFNSGKGLLDLINEILDLSKIEAGKMDLNIEEIRVSDFINSLKNLFTPIAKEKNISLKFNYQDSLEEFIKTDRLRIDQVLKNLISNAIKFTEKGGVIINLSSNAQNITFEVIDSGIGIPKDKQKLVFEAFQQADGSTRRKFGGTGLGLSIARDISILLGGKLQLQSTVGTGSTFTLVLPLTPNLGITPNLSTEVLSITDDSLLKIEDENVLKVTPNEIEDDRHNISNQDEVILVIEDDTSFAAIIRDYARNRGYKVIISVSGATAAKYAKKYQPIGIMLDIQLPAKSGWTVMKELKKSASTKHIPVHMMSSLDIPRRESVSKGAIDFINKPMMHEQLLQVLNKLKDVNKQTIKQILIIENNESHKKALEVFIGNSDKKCISASDADTGMKLLKTEQVDCIILDMGLPDDTGYQLLENIRNLPQYETLPIIIFTGKSLSVQEEIKIKKYASTIVLKTASSYQRLMDEIVHFLHLVETEDDKKRKRIAKFTSSRNVLIGKNVLVVDDDIRNVFSLTKLLENHSMVVYSSSNGKEALEALNNTKFDIILMDMMMPEMDGYMTMQAIRENKKLLTLPIIAVTAKTMLGDRQKCIDAGASDYISKPVDSDQLISLMRIWLQKK